MRIFKTLAFLLPVAFALSQQNSQAAQTTVEFDSGGQMMYSTAAKTAAVALTAGAVNTAGDGAVLELGYYSSGSVGNYFNGTFVALSGPQSADTAFAHTTIGDKPADAAGDGTFALTLNFVAGSATTGQSLPLAGTPLVLRFYNATTIPNSTKFNDVSDSLWQFQTPADTSPLVTISLDDANLQWLGGAATAFYTSQTVAAVPEPSSLLAVAGGAGLVYLAVQRRKTAKI